jgi:hypothetical protein
MFRVQFRATLYYYYSLLLLLFTTITLYYYYSYYYFSLLSYIPYPISRPLLLLLTLLLTTIYCQVTVVAELLSLPSYCRCRVTVVAELLSLLSDCGRVTALPTASNDLYWLRVFNDDWKLVAANRMKSLELCVYITYNGAIASFMSH